MDATRSSSPAGGASAASRYARNERSAGGTHALVLRLVPDGSTVLDVGCASGYLGEALAARGCEVFGLDRDASAVARVPPCYRDAVVLDLEEADALPWREPFDVIVAADVLEHLRDPARALRLLRRSLRDDGIAVLSLPNVAHVSVRVPLLLGRFRYRTTGILDETHCRLFTVATARELAESCGFRVERTLAGSDRFGALVNGHPALARALTGLLAHSIVLLCRPRAAC
jgi:SAM-dependent methyltransferase